MKQAAVDARKKRRFKAVGRAIIALSRTSRLSDLLAAFETPSPGHSALPARPETIQPGDHDNQVAVAMTGVRTPVSVQGSDDEVSLDGDVDREDLTASGVSVSDDVIEYSNPVLTALSRRGSIQVSFALCDYRCGSMVTWLLCIHWSLADFKSTCAHKKSASTTSWKRA